MGSSEIHSEFFVSTTIRWLTFKFGTVDFGVQDIHPNDFSDSMTSSGTALSLTGVVQMFIILLDFIFPLSLDLVPLLGQKFSLSHSLAC